MRNLQTRITITLTLLVLTPSATAQEPEKYLLLATNRTGTMQDELNEAGARGYRFAGTQGGETAFGGREAVVIMALDPEGRRFRYILLATNRSGTMQREMNEAPPEVATDYLVTVSRRARAAGLLSDEHFTVDGTQLEAWASLKSFRPRKWPEEPPPDDLGNPTVNFRDERGATTHTSRRRTHRHVWGGVPGSGRALRPGYGRDDAAAALGAGGGR